MNSASNPLALAETLIANYGVRDTIGALIAAVQFRMNTAMEQISERGLQMTPDVADSELPNYGKFS